MMPSDGLLMLVWTLLSKSTMGVGVEQEEAAWVSGQVVKLCFGSQLFEW